MRSSIATYRESLSRIASELSDDDEQPQFTPAAASLDSQSSSSGRRRRRSLRVQTPHSASAGSPIPNGSSCAEHEPFDEIARYRADIQKLQTSEAEIKALSFNYAAMLKEKEDQLAKLREENGSLKKNLEAKVCNTSPKGNLGNSRAVGNNSAKFVNNMNGVTHNTNGVYKPAISLENDKDYTQVGEKKSLESEIRELKERLKNEQEKSTKVIKKLEDENKRNDSLQREILELNAEKEKMSKQVRDLQKELNEKTSELKELKQVKQEITKTPLKKDEIEEEESIDDLKNLIKSLEKENTRLKEEITTIMNKRASESVDRNNSESQESVISQLEKKLVIITKEKEKYLQELSRLKQHLLEKENEDSIMEELEIKIEDQNLQIVQLERALRQETARKDEIKILKDQEIQKLNELNNGLSKKLASCLSNLEMKNTELVNLQTALGQYYAESEAKERIGRDLALARDEINRLTVSLNVANQGIEMAKREKDEIISKLSQIEATLNEAKKFIQKLEEDKSRLNLAMEKSMRALNRMSLDSDNQVDRRIVIKLLVTYFQRNHSKEVLDLMVRMLGFSEEEKDRIGGAQRTAGKGVVRGVLGLPGKFVGGILGGSSASGAHHQSSSNDQESFADLWVDFLLKEEEEREKREASSSSSNNNNKDEIAKPNQTNNNNVSSNYSNTCTNYSNSEFSSVPLNSTSFSPQR